MGMHGRARVSARFPRSLAICDRCGALVNHDTLAWQFRWHGPRLQNVRLLVCSGCFDKPNEQERLIVLPPDPVPIQNARPENYVLADNPLSGLGFNPANMYLPTSSLGTTIGNMNANAGLDAAFSASPTVQVSTGPIPPQSGLLINKRYEFCAALLVSNSSYQNFIGKNWAGEPSGIALSSTIPAQTHVVSGFTAYAPNDQPFLRTGPTGWQFQAGSNGATWTTLASGTTAGTAGEVLSVTSTAGAAYQYHQLALQGDGFSAIGIAGLVISVSDGPSNEI